MYCEEYSQLIQVALSNYISFLFNFRVFLEFILVSNFLICSVSLGLRSTLSQSVNLRVFKHICSSLSFVFPGDSLL